MSFSKETGLSPNSWCWQPQNLETNASIWNQEGCAEIFLKKCSGTYVMRFPPRTAQAGTVRKRVGKWNLGLICCTYPLLSISAGAEPMERALIHGALPTTLKTHPRTLARGYSWVTWKPSCIFGLKSTKAGSLSLSPHPHTCCSCPFSVPLLVLLSFTAQPLLQDLI